MQAEIKTKEDVLEYLQKNGVTFVNLWFADILGQLKSFNVYKTEMEGALDEGMGFDGSSIEGFVRIEESDLVARTPTSAAPTASLPSSKRGSGGRHVLRNLQPRREPIRRRFVPGVGETIGADEETWF